MVRVAASWYACTLIANAANPEQELQAIVLSAHRVSRKWLGALKKNLQNRSTDGRFRKVCRVRSSDGIQHHRETDCIAHDARGVSATSLSVRVVSKANVFVECAGPSGPEYIRTGTFVQDSEGRLALYGKPEVFLVDSDQNVIYAEQAPEIRNGYVTHYVDGVRVVLGGLCVRKSSKMQALPGNTWALLGVTKPQPYEYQVICGQVTRGGQNTASILTEARDLERRSALGVALLREDR